MKSSLKSFRKGNFALRAARLLSDMMYEDEEAGSLVGMVQDASSNMMSRASLIEDVSSSGVRADGIPYCAILDSFQHFPLFFYFLKTN
jgi:hypothetical protein